MTDIALKIIEDFQKAHSYYVLFVVGPTASGKTKLGVELAKKLGGEVISLDSRQLYKHCDVGTAKVTKEEMDGVPHHLIDVCEPSEILTLVDVMKLALEKIKDCFDRGVLPICVGGTGLYVDAIARGYDEFNAKTFVGDARPEEVQKLRDEIGEFDVLEIAIDWQREELYDRINKRVVEMFDEGMIDEALYLQDKGFVNNPIITSIGYQWALDYLNEEISREEAIELTQRDTRRYAKKQMTWFRNHGDVQWIK